MSFIYSVNNLYKLNKCIDSAKIVLMFNDIYYFWLLMLSWFFSQLHEIMTRCFEEEVEKRHGASHIRRLLEEAWSTEGMWDTYL